mmetsp:Transcript_3995/g.10412  ORF Transcript_3995/g.10412 Transcript_3995/m.10412 type:complete len:288 (-) Transcript_3995:114-977(-)
MVTNLVIFSAELSSLKSLQRKKLRTTRWLPSSRMIKRAPFLPSSSLRIFIFSIPTPRSFHWDPSRIKSLARIFTRASSPSSPVRAGCSGMIGSVGFAGAPSVDEGFPSLAAAAAPKAKLGAPVAGTAADDAKEKSGFEPNWKTGLESFAGSTAGTSSFAGSSAFASLSVSPSTFASVFFSFSGFSTASSVGAPCSATGFSGSTPSVFFATLSSALGSFVSVGFSGASFAAFSTFARAKLAKGLAFGASEAAAGVASEGSVRRRAFRILRPWMTSLEARWKVPGVSSL